MSNKTVIITGATVGIGKVTADKFAKEGYNVVISGRNESRGSEVARAISEKHGGNCLFLKTDVNNEDEVKNLVGKTVNQFGKLDTIVNNAGIAGESTGFLGDCSTENFRNLLETNVLGLFYGMKYAIQTMSKNGGGSIVNLASIAGLNGILYSAQYCASKHAVVGLTKAAAVEYATQGIRVNAIAPGAIKTDILQAAIDAGNYSEESIAQMHPMNRMGTPEDIANGIYYLASDASPFMTGAVLSVDGGYNAR